MISIDEKTAMLCSVALFELSLRHKEDMPRLAEEAMIISDAIDKMIESKLFKKEN